MMTQPTTVNPDAARVLRSVAGLLREATHLLHERADAERATSPTRLVALGALLTFAQASALLTTPPFYDVPDRAGSDPLLLTEDAEQLLRTVPIERLPVGASSLVITLCDLVRELRAARG
ncbi:hypothetical protein [Leekyejoonella antrihumi]|uniref:Uncharacterized protein n=1 Tax=Leekyejoonella antrihumi TaxID=1660198 RepID=A0A563DW33_9MICO|nr:hypothetical protein [Leekyejoonella antrihumi]TWP34490.1 hypothetical protein FGL98_17410 [Leekyejoonella antrihumi]